MMSEMKEESSTSTTTLNSTTKYQNQNTTSGGICDDNDVEKGLNHQQQQSVSNNKALTPPLQATISHDSATNNSNSNKNNSHQQRQQQLLVFIRFAIETVGLTLLFIAAIVIFYQFGWMYGIPAIILAVAILLLTKVGYRWFYVAFKTLPRDSKGLFGYLRLLLLLRRFEKKNVTISDIFQSHVANNPDKVAIICDGREWTFRELNEFSTRLANVFNSHGYKRGDVVGLVLENRPEFVGIWLGLSKLGIVTPLVNTNLRGPSLLHSITVANSTALIYGEDYAEAINEINKDLPSTLALYQFNNEVSKPTSGLAKDLASLMMSVSKDKIPASAERADHHDKLLYIYTSGTTGLPKAAVISHFRYIFIAAGTHFTMGFKDDDIFYTPLPLYHTAGGVMSMGQAIIFGSTVVIRKKFSASGYFADCKKYNCTVAQYIGEMCRYILATPSSEMDKGHKLRMIFGNGLRPQIWPQFVQRFGIKKVGEFYGATEGNANIINNDSTVGAIGFMSRIVPSVYPISIIRADQYTGEPIRNEKGLCQLCKPNEPGVFIGKIVEGNPSREFLGYVDKKASEKKIVRDVFRKGDMAFLSGDVLVADEFGYLYFKDRTGDTFRWKGENVSTSEVEAQVSNVAGYRDSVVYGIEIPNTEGRAGMAAIYDPDNMVNLDEFSENIKKLLPVYARPQFLRFLNKIDLTGTFKLRKVDLQKEGFNPNIISDKLYYLTSKGKYENLTSDVYEQICRSELRF